MAKILSSVNFYPCSNINVTTNWYVNVLGLKLHQDQGNAKIFDTGYGYWGFVEYNDRKPNPSGLWLSLDCDSIESVDYFYSKIINEGVKTLSKPSMHKDFPVYSFFLQDPDGYTVEFQYITNKK